MSDLPPILKISEVLYRYADWLTENPTIRNERGLIHASDLCRGPGWECDRYIEYIRAVDRDINPRSTVPAAVRPIFWVGEGVELMADSVLPKALKQILPDMGYKYIALHKQVAGFDAELGIVVHADYVLEYSKDEEGAPIVRQVIDAKSTSLNQDKRRASGLRENLNESRPDPEHVRQVAIYKQMLNADYGSLLYITKTHPHRISDATVAGERVWPTISSRIRRIDKSMAEGNRVLPTRGSHCSECQWSQRCLNDTGLF